MPQFAMNHGDVEGLLHELRGFHEAFHECFTRSEPREHFLRYTVGQLSALERKSIEPIALRIEGGNVRAMQRRTKCEVPEDVEFRTQLQPAAVMLRDIRTAGLLAFNYVVADCLYGNSPAFLDAVEEDGSTSFFGSIPSDTRCWL